ncbi:DNA binding domain-containing protein, excisionase family [Thermomonospora echinospora]|uniref:DNA binding domain-containing protein, excisionase family n=1 Tax=Thermomonospora echinospora TaxID=1992 RepID=A0A1H5UU44_9ACTN|nr:helix-turn-helix domain-containing protein [Thermomonospora echinospora]SEF78480.1 DNA binding domain-containing protein, excisionase family [Thermomonospora echinospora]
MTTSGKDATPTPPERSKVGRDPDILTTEELATKLGLSPQTVRRMAAAGQIPALKAGKNFRYSWSAVLDVLRQPHPQPGATANDQNPDQDPVRTTTPPTGAGYRAQRQARAGAQHAD